MKELLAAIIAFFTSLLGLQPTPVPLTTDHQPLITNPTPLPTSAYPRSSYTNTTLNYTLNYPNDTTLQQSPDQQAVWDETYSLRIDVYSGPSLDMEAILATDLMCNADGPNGSISCQNTAVKPFTNQSGSPGFLIRRTKTITGTNQQTFADTAYVFPLNTGAVILSVEFPSDQNLQILTDIANWFTTLP